MIDNEIASRLMEELKQKQKENGPGVGLRPADMNQAINNVVDEMLDIGALTQCEVACELVTRKMLKQIVRDGNKWRIDAPGFNLTFPSLRLAKTFIKKNHKTLMISSVTSVLPGHINSIYIDGVVNCEK